MGGDCESPEGWSLSVVCLEDAHEEGCREVNLVAQTSVVSLRAGAFPQFSGSGPKQAIGTFRPSRGTVEQNWSYFMCWSGSALAWAWQCVHAEGATGTLTVTHHPACSPGPLTAQDNLPWVVLPAHHCSSQGL